MSSPDSRGTELVYLNGRLVQRSQAMVEAFDYGFLYGYGLFETMRAYNGVVFRLVEHVERLIQGGQRLGFAGCLRASQLAAACTDTVRANGLQEARVRLTVTPGNGDGLPDPSRCRVPTVLVTARPYSPPSLEMYQRGFSAVVAVSRRCSESVLSGVKGVSYAENVLARLEAQRRGADEALFLTDHGFLAEGSVSNLFVVKGGVLTTPGVEGILPGIARGDVLRLASAAGISSEQRPVKLQELLGADEAFLTNSIMEVMPLTRVEGKTIGNGLPGAVTSRLATDYRSLVGGATAQGMMRLE